MKEMVGGCCVCSDERGWPENPLVYCDGANCNVAVHQACYGIVTVPTGPWYCRKCESQERSARVRCELCPSRTGALKKTNTSGWAHVVCALYIPEVRFGNVTTMEPINLDSIPVERYGKTCYICQEMTKGSKATMGACMQCNKTGCRQQFHVTCAQQLGLLCEEAGNYLDNVKYCGYCQHHYSKLKKGGNVKLIPPYKPITYETGSSDGPSSPEKESEGVGGAIAGGQLVAGTQPQASSSSAPTIPDGLSASGASGPPSNPPNNSNTLHTLAASKGIPPTTSTSGSGSQAIGNSASSQVAAQSNTATGSSSASSSSSKNRKSSSTSKGSSASTSTTGTSGGGTGSTNQQGSSAPAQSTSVGGTGSSSTNNSNGSSKSSGGGGGGSGPSSGSSKEYKEKHSKGASKAPSSKDRDTYKEKSTKSTSFSATSSTSSSSSSTSSAKNKESTSSGHHHQSHGEIQMKVDHSRSDKASTGGGSSINSNKSVPNSSILAPSVLATTAAKEVAPKYPYMEQSGGDGVIGPGGLPPDAGGGSFVNESKLSTSGGGASSSASAAATAPVATKKRKASDSSKLHSSIEDKIPMKDVSVTLIPLRHTMHHDKIDGGGGGGGSGDSKKVKSERGSPLHGISSDHSNPGTGNNSSSVGSAAVAAAANLLATQTGATSISITKQPPSQPTTTNVIIKPPIMKDLVSHLSGSASVSVSNTSSSSSSSTSLSSLSATSGGGGNGTTSLVVSVPLSPVAGGAALNLPGSGGGSSSASQNLFQQAIQNRSEHLNFPNASRSTTSQQQQHQSGGQSVSRSSPSIPTGGIGGHHHLGAEGHVGMLHRQSPLIQASNLNLDNGGRSSLSPQISGNVVHQSEGSGMLKVTYEKQPSSTSHGNIVSVSNSSRLASLQDDAMSSSRRSSADCGIFQSGVTGGVPPTKGLFGSSTSKRASRSSNDYGLVTSSSNIAKNCSEKESNSNPSPSNLFTSASVTAVPSFKSSASTNAMTATRSSTSPAALFSSFVTSSRTPDFNSFGGGSSGGGLKISYEPQAALSVATASNTTLLTPSPSPSMPQMSGCPPSSSSIASNTIGAQPMLKDSPPSSPSSEAGSSARKRTRKQESIQAIASNASSSHGKVFQNGVHASHMLGNQLNPNSSVAQKMSDQLHMELEAHSVYTNESALNLMGPVFPGKHTSTSSTSSSSSSAAAAASKGPGLQGPPSLSSMLSGGNTASGGAPQSLEQLLERQWEQGSQFLMEQAQHFDIASLLSCLHQLRAENVRLEDHVNNLVARRDHLLAVNARLAIPLNQATSGSGSFNATNGPTEGPPPTNVIQRGSEPVSRSGGRGGGHGGYVMENGIDFRSAVQQQQQQQQHQQSMMMGGIGHQGQGQGPGSSGGSGNPAGVVRTTNVPVTGCSGGGVVVVAAATTNNGTVAGSIGGGGGSSGICNVRSSSNPNNHSHQLNSSCSGGGGGSLGLGSSQSNGSLPSGVIGLPSSSSLMSSGGGGGGVVGSSVVSGTNTVTALGMISGASRPIPSAPVGISYPTHFQHFRRDDAQMKPS